MDIHTFKELAGWILCGAIILAIVAKIFLPGLSQ